MAAWALRDAETSAREVFARAFGGEPQIVTRHGVPSLVIITYAEFESSKHGSSLAKPTKKPSFVEFLKNCPADLSDINLARDKDACENREPVFAEDVFA